MNDRNKIERAKSKNKVSKNQKNEKQEIILKPMKYIKITTYEDCFQIMNPIQKTVQRLSKLPFKPKSQEGIFNRFRWRVWNFKMVSIGSRYSEFKISITLSQKP